MADKVIHFMSNYQSFSFSEILVMEESFAKAGDFV